MNNEYDTFTKDKNKLSYLVQEILLNLGFRPANKGTLYFKELILEIYINNLDIYNINDIYKLLSEKYNCSASSICKSIQYAILNTNYTKLRNNFYNILNYEYDETLLSNKQLAELIKNKLDRIE